MNRRLVAKKSLSEMLHQNEWIIDAIISIGLIISHIIAIIAGLLQLCSLAFCGILILATIITVWAFTLIRIQIIAMQSDKDEAKRTNQIYNPVFYIISDMSAAIILIIVSIIVFLIILWFTNSFTF